MARRVRWTNNSSGHSGTYVYRAPTLDPQNLPAPVATVGPVAQGATAEWIDNEAPFECYVVQDFDGQGVGTLSAALCVDDPAPDYASATIGDELAGGIYAGIDTIGGTDYYIISSNAAAEGIGLQWKTTTTDTPGAGSDEDGLANTDAMVVSGISSHPAGQHCVNYDGGGFSDWHMPARNQVTLLYNNLAGHPEFSNLVSSGAFMWANQRGTNDSWMRRFSDGTPSNALKTDARRVRPIRRVPV